MKNGRFSDAQIMGILRQAESGVNGRAKVSQRAAQNVATLGLGYSACRRAPASGQPRLSYSWRLPGCFGPVGPICAD
jgi:hypothetical protein